MVTAMQHITVTDQEGIRTIALGRGKANAMNGEMLNEIGEAVRSAGGQALVFTSAREKFFSSGFDVQEVFALERPAMEAFFGGFLEIMEAVLRHPRPTVAAVSGHAYAGGAVLAVMCDARVFAEGPFGFALNEVNLGILLPPGILARTVMVAGSAAARDLLHFGQTYSPAQARACGLAHAVAPPDQAPARAAQLAADLAAKPPGAYALVKQAMQRQAGLAGTDRDHLAAFLDQWFSAECRAAREKLAASLRR
jgi:enoyl-CoA hydratase